MMARCEASAYAVTMPLTAVDNVAGAGELRVAEKTTPMICADVQNFSDDLSKLTPSAKPPAVVEMLTQPVMEEVGAVDMPITVKIT